MSGANAPPTGPLSAPMGTPQAQQIMDALTGRDAENEPDRLPRTPPVPEEPRRRLVTSWQARVAADKRHFKATFARMKANQAFTHGDQWTADLAAAPTNLRDPRYVANIALRHVQQRTASLYANNPKVVARVRERMLAVVWDGDMATLAQAQQAVQQAAQAQAVQAQQTGVPVVPGQAPPGLDPHALAILTDFKNVQGYHKMLKRVGKTLELLWEYNVDEQTFPFKPMMKLTVRRAIVTGVGYVKLGFQRAMHMAPEIETKIADMTQRLATVQRLAEDIADGEIHRDAAEAEQLRLTIAGLMQEPQVIVREGLTFDYPDPAAIIPDKKCKSLHGFLGADWVTQEFMLTPDEIQEVYRCDVCNNYRAYSPEGHTNDAASDIGGGQSGDNPDHQSRAAVWEIYSRTDGLVYVVCDGYPDFLREPAPPDDYLDRFYPWFPMILNEGYNEKDIFPRSDIDLLRDMQLELNRARQGLREHRRANRPKMVTSAGILEQADKDKLRTHPANALIELNGLAPGQKVEDLLQPVKMPAIDPALYDTNSTFEDILRVLGQDQASMGQTTSSTATEASVAQSAQHTDLSSVLDDQDELLSEIAQAAGRLLLLNVSAQTVQKIIGPGAVWPELTKEQVVDNIYLEVQAGSTGRPNKQQEIMNAQILFPMLQRIPGISPEWMARELIKRMDDRLDLTEAFVEGMPSMDALNRAGPVQDPTNPAAQAAPGPATGAPLGLPGQPPPGASPGPGGGGAPMAPPMGGAPNDPTAQGPNGARNIQVPPPANGLLGPRTPPVPGVNGLMPGQGGGPRNTPQGALPVP